MLYIILLAYRQPLEIVDRHLAEHRAFLARHYQAGHFLLSGPTEPRDGGAILACAPDRATLDAWLQEDPFDANGVASYTVVAWRPTLRAEDIASRMAPSAAAIAPAGTESDAADSSYPIAVHASTVPARAVPSAYPAPFAQRVRGREKRVLGEVFGLRNFGVNYVTLRPGAQSALRHGHSRQDEFVHVLEGELTLITDAGETPLVAGMSAGFRSGTGDAHCLVNRSASPAIYLEVGDRSHGDRVHYPDDDLVCEYEGGIRYFLHRDATPY